MRSPRRMAAFIASKTASTASTALTLVIVASTATRLMMSALITLLLRRERRGSSLAGGLFTVKASVRLSSSNSWIYGGSGLDVASARCYGSGMSLPLVAIVGAPNVGKSTLFNRLVGRRRAIVTSEAGMTRDRLYDVVREARRPFRVVDTGGVVPRADLPYAKEIEGQAEQALAEAQVVVFVVDARAGATGLDRDLVAWLRPKGLPVVLVANKVEGPGQEAAGLALAELGLGSPHLVSAEHSSGIDELVEAIVDLLPRPPTADEPPDDGDRVLEVAIVGRPNVGKSSILNRLVGSDRAIVSDRPGTTRDAIDAMIESEGRRIRIVDTAGIRRRGKVERGPERFSVVHARQGIERADVVILVVDATQGFTAQDAHIAGEVREAWRPLVVAVNKWDLVEDRENAAKRWAEEIRDRPSFLPDVPHLLVSAKSGLRVGGLFELAAGAHTAACRRVGTVELNRWLAEHREGDPDRPPPKGSLRLFYATQTGIEPPRFLLFCNDPRRAHFSLRRRLENSLRERFAFGAAPLRLELRGRRPTSER